MNENAIARGEPIAKLDGDLLEKRVQDEIVKIARSHGYELKHHTVRSERGDSGFPDLVLVSTERAHIVFVEVKRNSGRRSEAQIRWGDALTNAGVDYHCWNQNDIESGVVDNELYNGGYET